MLTESAKQILLITCGASRTFSCLQIILCWVCTLFEWLSGTAEWLEYNYVSGKQTERQNEHILITEPLGKCDIWNYLHLISQLAPKGPIHFQQPYLFFFYFIHTVIYLLIISCSSVFYLSLMIREFIFLLMPNQIWEFKEQVWNVNITYSIHHWLMLVIRTKVKYNNNMVCILVTLLFNFLGNIQE